MSDLPIVQALQHLGSQADAAFYAPGHKRGQGIAPVLQNWWGPGVFQADLPELPDFDNLFAPGAAIQQAQELAAQRWGAEHTWFLVNGSTAGVLAMVLATCGEGDVLLLPRNCHRSAITALVLFGAYPVFLEPAYDPAWDLALGFSPATLRQALQAHPQAKAVLALYPTYHGVGADLKSIADLCHQQGLPLLVDEAHGAHFGFHPALPPSALSLGADLTVQSTHKTLGALSQAAMLHGQGPRISPERIQSALALVQSTSPSALLLASLDAARQQVQEANFFQRPLDLAQQARQALADLPGLRLLTEESRQAGFAYLDPTRLTVDVSGLGLTGFAVDDILRQRYQVTAELPTLRQLSFIITHGNTAQDIQQLMMAFQGLAQTGKPIPNTALTVPLPPSTRLGLTPRQAYFAATEIVPLTQAMGRLSASLLCPYPPGIPVLIPGEVITDQALAYLQNLVDLGADILGADDESLQSLRVIR
ncbi:aminotransferase class I/II-fold pyridoxal phosphate-dependent enzyme [Synechocystis sp. LKSZ1]|uniref:aminotransferase class I/II-fold pyridoxal phosphate-dependent enzyme n=1 Tax=Synechocystis sp. LKSZ1 TaxID=3144951 RepID=UPI00336C131B